MQQDKKWQKNKKLVTSKKEKQQKLTVNKINKRQGGFWYKSDTCSNPMCGKHIRTAERNSDNPVNPDVINLFQILSVICPIEYYQLSLHRTTFVNDFRVRKTISVNPGTSIT